MRQVLPIVVECPDCGESRVRPEQVTVRRCVDSGQGSYRFACPTCRLLTVGDSQMSALMRAVDAGAGFESWTMPSELNERPDGPLFTLADVFELHLLLLEPDWFDEIVALEVDG